MLLAARRIKARITELKDGQGYTFLNQREIEKEVICFFDGISKKESKSFCLKESVGGLSQTRSVCGW